MELIPLIRRLSEASGVSGYEHEVRDIVLDVFGRFADEVRLDTLGNVIALKKGLGPEPRPSVMIATHMDEIGLIVSSIEDGFLHFMEVGGYDERILLGQEVVVHGRRDLPGVIASRPPHVLAAADRDKPIPRDKLLIDVGLEPEALNKLVRVGDLITMNQKLVELGEDLVAGKALDDRVSVAAAAVCLETLSQIRHSWDLFAVATVQEEVGLKGAVTSAYGLQPDIGVAVDVTFASQPGAPAEFTFDLGSGPTIGVGPNFHPKLQAALVDAARSLEMKYSLEPAERPAGTDAAAIQIARQGIPTELISIPIRNMHTPVETVAIRDVQRAGRLLAHFVGQLDEDFLASLTYDLGLEDTVGG